MGDGYIRLIAINYEQKKTRNDEPTNKRTNEQTNKQTNKQTNERTANEQTNKRTNCKFRASSTYKQAEHTNKKDATPRVHVAPHMGWSGSGDEHITPV